MTPIIVQKLAIRRHFSCCGQTISFPHRLEPGDAPDEAELRALTDAELASKTHMTKCAALKATDDDEQ